jgi:hypothetical protein
MTRKTATPLKVGAQLHSGTCTTSVIVVRPPAGEVVLCCGGQPMLDAAPASPTASIDPELASGTLIGKRYVHENGLEVVCTKAGQGTLSVDGEPLAIKGPAPLPSSD